MIDLLLLPTSLHSFLNNILDQVLVYQTLFRLMYLGLNSEHSQEFFNLPFTPYGRHTLGPNSSEGIRPTSEARGAPQAAEQADETLVVSTIDAKT